MMMDRALFEIVMRNHNFKMIARSWWQNILIIDVDSHATFYVLHVLCTERSFINEKRKVDGNSNKKKLKRKKVISMRDKNKNFYLFDRATQRAH